MTSEEKAYWIEYFKTDLMVKNYGIEIVYWDIDYVEVTVEIGPKVNSKRNVLHGGAILGISDMVAGWVTMADGSFCVSQTCNVNFVSNTDKGCVRFIGKPVHRGKKTCVARVEAYDANDRLISTADFTMFKLDMTLAEKYNSEKSKVSS